MPAYVCVLNSGSGGNCTAIWSSEEAILIDCGWIGIRGFEDYLCKIGLIPAQIQGIIVTHGHGDHINGSTLRISKSYKIPIYVHQETFREVKKKYQVDGLTQLIRHHTDRAFSVGTFRISPFRTVHGSNCGRPYGFHVSRPSNGRMCRIGVISDTREVTDQMVKLLADCSHLIIESNHSREKIARDGSHPNWDQHLSNDAAADAIIRIMSMSSKDRKLKHVVLAHISQSNNSIEHIKKEVFMRLQREGVVLDQIVCAKQDKPTKVYTIS